jgi:hypothetical protein
MGYAVPLLSHGRISDLRAMVDILQSLEAQNSSEVKGVFRDV